MFIPAFSTDPHPHFPIEGKSHWPLLMRAMAMGSVVGLGVIAFVLGAFDAKGLDENMEMILLGIGVFFAAEFIGIRFGLVPRLAGYGRYRVFEHKVDFYPLSACGMCVASKPESVPISKFRGVSTLVVETGGQVYGAGVFLIHQDRGKTLSLKGFQSVDDARAYAQSLADMMKISVLPWEDNMVLIKPKKRAL